MKARTLELLLEALANTAPQKKVYDLYPTDRQIERLQDHLVWDAENEERTKDFKPGMFLRLTRAGKTYYGLPWVNQKCILVRRFPRMCYGDNGEKFANAEVAIVIEKLKIMNFAVDLNYYEEDK